jgi:hypothetical protein
MLIVLWERRNVNDTLGTVLHPFPYTINITLFTKHYLHSTLHLPQNTIYVTPCPMHN